MTSRQARGAARPRKQKQVPARRCNARVLQVAERLRARTRAEAHGRCLGLSLALCHALGDEGARLELVTWRVVADDAYADHWAVGIGGGWVVDPTRLQVDGRSAVLHRIGDYPPNYQRPQAYPARLLLPRYARFEGSAEERFAAHFLYSSRWLMLRHDLARSLRERLAAVATRSLLSLGRFAFACGVEQLRHRLEARRDSLLRRIAGEAQAAQAR